MHKVLFTLFGGKITIYTYSVCIVIGLIAGAFVFRYLCKRLKMSEKSYDYYSFLAILTIMFGFVSAYIFQDIYTVLAGKPSTIVRAFSDLFSGKGFSLDGGITFMGGLIGGAAFFIAGTLLAKDKSIRDEFPLVADVAAPVIMLAHGFGRVGCFFGGCCYGKETHSFLGMDYPVNGVWQHRYPTQLYEALFCFIMFAIFMFIVMKVRKRGLLIVFYAASYSIFRFLLEFLRDDFRGGANIGISPSQIQSLVLIFIAIAYVYLKVFWWDKRKEKAALSAANNNSAKTANENEVIPTNDEILQDRGINDIAANDDGINNNNEE